MLPVNTIHLTITFLEIRVRKKHLVSYIIVTFKRKGCLIETSLVTLTYCVIALC